ncbi:probable sodium/potassium/calcium exchanger CG1090 [Daphnia pulex]|uniref:probable sodium/potassium/calcium exchanger CG1090 n=1 Tax=Daphnia pulex TaxID=6669 RepID=UPI001EDD74E9|nr:probable sodium/potassium/calcium exchanger CG1090 [Daphnia pulex]
MSFQQPTAARSVGPVFARCKRANRRRCMWAYLVGLSVLALILVTSHLPRSGFNPTTFVDNDDPIESVGLWRRHLLANEEKRTSTATPILDPFAGINCTPPAIEEFPRPGIPQYVRAKGGLVVHLLVSAYMFLGLSIVCDDYFVPALERMVESLHMSQDVAGATFMAAGSSAPELATAVIGVFIAKDDIGISGVIGSAVFNIMFVISVCALFSGGVIYLNWWPLVRDCIAYFVAIFALLFTIYNEVVTWYESTIFLMLYVAYCVMMVYNSQLERWANTLPIPIPDYARRLPGGENASLMPYKNLDSEAGGISGPAGKLYTDERSPDSVKSSIDGNVGPCDAGGTSGPSISKIKEEEAERFSPWVPPVEFLDRITWAICLPLRAAAYYTMPNCRLEKWGSWFLVSFFISMLWISIFSYVMVWMITIIGFTMGIPDTVMGLTFVAAGVSIPDILTSLAVAREGYGDMATSNAIGSNVFDILICLGLPWFLQTAVVDPGSVVRVISKGLTYSTLSLLSTIVFLLGATHLNGWKLDRKYGVALLGWYLFFMIIASMYEMNIFGYFNPPECDSEF